VTIDGGRITGGNNRIRYLRLDRFDSFFGDGENGRGLIRVVKREYKSIIVVVFLVGLAGLAYIYPSIPHFGSRSAWRPGDAASLFSPPAGLYDRRPLRVVVFVGRSAVQMTFDSRFSFQV
jgi:hypothetical protein